MTDTDNQIDQIREIRDMMAKSSRFISLSGLAGVFAGFFALAGAWAFYVYINRSISYSEIAKEIPVTIKKDFVLFCLLDASSVIVLSLAFAVFFTTRKAKSMGQKIWDATAQRMLISLAVPLIAGGIYCLMLLKFGLFGLIAPTTLIFYGLALANASKYTMDEIRYLGLSEIILGLTGCFFIGYGITFWSIGFGVLHIIYGLIMYMRYDAKPQEKKYW